MLNFGPTFIWVAVNLIILYFILKHILFKPVTDLMENRSNMIKQSLKESEESRISAAKLKQKYQNQLKNAKGETEKIMNNAVARANAEYNQILSDAKRKAQNMIEKTKQEIEIEWERAKKDLNSHVADLALDIASKLMQKNMDTEVNREIINKIINEDEDGAA